jgi:hypothetical protein
MAVLPELGMHRFHADGLADGLLEARSVGHDFASGSDKRLMTHIDSWLAGSEANR